MNDTALKEKVHQLQLELSDWAVEQSLIMPGDTILLSYVIQEESVSRFLNMPLSEFFSPQRCKSARARAFAKSLEQEGEIVTVRDLLECEYLVELFRFSPLGRRSRLALIDALVQAKLPLSNVWTQISKRSFA